MAIAIGVHPAAWIRSFVVEPSFSSGRPQSRRRAGGAALGELGAAPGRSGAEERRLSLLNYFGVVKVARR